MPSKLELILGSDHSQLAVVLPSGCTVQIPPTEQGARTLLHLLLEQERESVRFALQAREAAQRSGNALDLRAAAFVLSVGSDVSPTQHSVDEMVGIRVTHLPTRDRHLTRKELSEEDFL